VKPVAAATLRHAVRRLMPIWALALTAPWAGLVGHTMAAALGLMAAPKGP
jgi:hypothetical protein